MKNKGFWLAAFVYILFTPLCLMAQTARPMRMEFTCPEDQKPFELINVGQQGCILFFKTEITGVKDQYKWNFSLYDANLRLVWTKDFNLPEAFDFKLSQKEDQEVFFLFQNSGRKGNNDELHILAIGLQHGEIRDNSLLMPAKSNTVAFLMMKGTAVIALNTHDDKGQVIIKDLTSGASSSFVVETDNKTFLKELIPDSTNKTFSLNYLYFPEKKHTVFCIKTYNPEGKEIVKYNLDPYEAGKSINNGKLIRLDSNRVMIMGDYSNDHTKSMDDLEKQNVESTGLYSAVFYKGQLVRINYKNFLDFKHFFNKIRGNQAIYEVEGKPKNKEVSSNYRLILHDVIQHDKEYILITEAYYPEYHTVTNWTYDYYGRMVPNYYSVFDGYRYNNSFVTGFDSTGVLLWDNSFEINNILTLSIQTRINVLFDDQEIVLAYCSDGKIVSKVLNREETISQSESVDLEQLDNRDRLIDDHDSNMSYWYRNIMLCHGYQKIKNTSRSDSRRNVFYISKIAYR